MLPCCCTCYYCWLTHSQHNLTLAYQHHHRAKLVSRCGSRGGGSRSRNSNSTKCNSTNSNSTECNSTECNSFHVVVVVICEHNNSTFESLLFFLPLNNELNK